MVTSTDNAVSTANEAPICPKNDERIAELKDKYESEQRFSTALGDSYLEEKAKNKALRKEIRSLHKLIANMASKLHA